MIYPNEIDQITFAYAMRFVGTPYSWGGDDFASLDCSGLVIEILKSCGILPNKFDASSQTLYTMFTTTHGSVVKGAGFGCLAFYGKSIYEIRHVVYCLDSKRAIGANGGNSETENTADAIRENAFVKVRPIHYRKDLVAICKPHQPAFL